MYSWFFVNLANILFALAYLVRDIFWLRVISVVACSANAIYLFQASDKPLWWGIGWDIAFVAINAVQIVVLVREKRTVHFGVEENEVFETVFKPFTPLEYRRLLNVMHWADLPVGSELTREGEKLSTLMLIYRGAVKVEKKERLITKLKSGDFVGEMSFVSSDVATATVTAVEETRLMCWDKSKLRKLLDYDPGLKISLEGVLGFNMADKLNRHG